MWHGSFNRSSVSSSVKAFPLRKFWVVKSENSKAAPVAEMSRTMQGYLSPPKIDSGLLANPMARRNTTFQHGNVLEPNNLNLCNARSIIPTHVNYSLKHHPLKIANKPLGAREPHGSQSQRRETIAVPSKPSTRAAPLDRSMHRPLTNGPRSFIRTVTLRPVEWDVTVTRDPNGLDRWAAVSAPGFIRSPDAVRPPA